MSADRPLIRVAVPIPLAEGFDYLWDGDGAPPEPGTRVEVPFGRGRRIGVVIEHPDRTDLPAEKLRGTRLALDSEPLLGAELLATLRWASDYYQHPIGEVLSHALPGLLRKGRPIARAAEATYVLSAEGAAAALDTLRGKAARQAAVLERLAEGPATAAALRERAGSAATLKRLLEKGWIAPAATSAAAAAVEVSPRRAPLEEPPVLTADQHAAVATIRAAAGAFLLYGVTGSGKTEVFLRLVADELSAGRQSLLLVPEIGLTPQLVARLSERFGDALALMHSGLSDGERLDAWKRTRAGRAGVVVGTRSAVFAPLARPGLIIVDEEHDTSYKQQQGFRYSARDVAVLRARRLGISVVLASATPSLESFHNAREGRYRLVEMPRRIGAAGAPRVRVIDLGRHGSRQGLSTPLLEAIDRHLADGRQVLLFLNRRGFAPTLFCPTCHDVQECRRCDARLTVHASAGELRCHHCGATRPLAWACPRCGTERAAVGAGTQRVDEELKALYPQARIGRLDRDATARKGALGAALADASRGDTRIVVGTQMLTKGHDFPNVTLVGVLNADQGLFGTDFRSDERLAQTIVQVAGRAGRRDAPGEVLIQTYHPSHPLLACLLKEGYGAFAKLALDGRQRAGWPPFSHLVMWRAEATQRAPVAAFLGRVRAAASVGGVKVLGPAPAQMERKDGRYRMQLLLQCSERPPLRALLARLVPEARAWREARRVRWSVDVDPLEA
jgi:primosomal protein N' (replication factor Y) (superfamily II helicase)